MLNRLGLLLLERVTEEGVEIPKMEFTTRMGIETSQKKTKLPMALVHVDETVLDFRDSSMSRVNVW